LGRLVFFAFVLDAYSRMIVGWQLAGHMRTDLVLDALRMALRRRQPGADVELIHHGDRGSQYTSVDYTQTLADRHVLASVGSVGDAYDNALAESFVDTFKTELITDRVWQSRSQLELGVVEYIGWYNTARPHESLGDIPPLEYEQRHTTTRRIGPQERSCEPHNPVPVKPGPAQRIKPSRRYPRLRQIIIPATSTKPPRTPFHGDEVVYVGRGPLPGGNLDMWRQDGAAEKRNRHCGGVTDRPNGRHDERPRAEPPRPWSQSKQICLGVCHAAPCCSVPKSRSRVSIPRTVGHGILTPEG
jgi:Integrase core domain